MPEAAPGVEAVNEDGIRRLSKPEEVCADLHAHVRVCFETLIQ